ncbi:MAG: SPOR domain-containing protein [Rhodoluna sp.]
MAKAKQFWFNTKTGLVEEGRKTLALYRIGPFESKEQAQRAYEIIQKRNEKLDQENKDQS